MIDQITALSRVNQAVAPNTSLPATANTAATPAFGDVLSGYATQTMNSLKAGEAASIAAIQGKASTQEVVEAVIVSEQSLQVSLAIRDKFVQSYLELSRMAI